MKGKIGIGVITCDRPEMLKKCISSIDSKWYDKLLIVNDGSTKIETKKYDIINNETNLGVGKSKNKALAALLNTECEHLFLVEDDVVFKDNAFKAYIDASKATKVKHFNYCLHGQDNKLGNNPNPRKIIDIRGTRVALYFNVYGAVSYYHRSAIDDVGLMDEEYINAMEHVDHTMKLIVKKYHPPFRWFIDLENSNNYIQDQDYNHNQSKIRSGNWIANFRKGVERFKEKYNIDVTNPMQPYDGIDTVLKYFKSL